MMIGSVFFVASQNPFVAAWMDTDFIGRVIFIALLSLSLISWTILLHKWWITNRVRAESALFKRSFAEQKQTPLHIKYAKETNPETPNAFFLIYEVLKNKTSELMEKNQQGKVGEGSQVSHLLASSDIAFLETHAASTISMITRYLERNLYLLSTIVTLAPFLGLLGTVYGILVTFSGMGEGGVAASNAQVLGGLSLALTTTVLGLINAIPALIGYSYLKNKITDFDHEMERFSTEVLSTFTMHYRTVEV
jgi:biopolymer transport protein ExbB/TolQ